MGMGVYKEARHYRKVGCYFSYVSIWLLHFCDYPSMQISSAGKGFMQWEVILE